MSMYDDLPEKQGEQKQPPKPNYYKVEEKVVDTHPEAEEIAEEMFAPHGKKALDGSRTTEEAKVRIRRRRGAHGQPDSFRVVFYRRIKEKKEAKPNKKKRRKKKNNAVKNEKT